MFHVKLSAHEHHKDVYVTGGDSRDSARLSQRFGVDVGKFLTGLGRETLYLFVLEPSPDVEVLQALHLFSQLPLSLDVAMILDLNLSGFSNFLSSVGRMAEDCSQGSDVRSKVLEGKFRTGYQVNKFTPDRKSVV